MDLAGLSPVGWCVLGVTAFFILSINAWLFSLLRNRRASGHSADTVKRTLATLRNPFARENDRLEELARQVERLKQPPEE